MVCDLIKPVLAFHIYIGETWLLQILLLRFPFLSMHIIIHFSLVLLKHTQQVTLPITEQLQDLCSRHHTRWLLVYPCHSIGELDYPQSFVSVFKISSSVHIAKTSCYLFFLVLVKNMCGLTDLGKISLGMLSYPKISEVLLRFVVPSYP